MIFSHILLLSNQAFFRFVCQVLESTSDKKLSFSNPDFMHFICTFAAENVAMEMK